MNKELVKFNGGNGREAFLFREQIDGIIDRRKKGRVLLVKGKEVPVDESMEDIREKIENPSHELVELRMINENLEFEKAELTEKVANLEAKLVRAEKEMEILNEKITNLSKVDELAKEPKEVQEESNEKTDI